MSWAGVASMEPGRLAFRGALGSAHRHAHAALQLVVVTSGSIRLTTGSTGRALTVSDLAVIPVGVEHALESDNAAGLMIYLDPLDALASALGSGSQPRPGAAAIEELRDQLAALELRDAMHRILAALTGKRATPRPGADCHPCLREAVRLLPGLLDGPVRLGELAEVVSLSPSRLSRLFADELGLSFPAYVRWTRLRRAVERLRTGGNLTDAAHAGGFTDSAHLNRVCHQMLGLAPSAIASDRLRWE